jgi:hypothetical protein
VINGELNHGRKHECPSAKYHSPNDLFQRSKRSKTPHEPRVQILQLLETQSDEKATLASAATTHHFKRWNENANHQVFTGCHHVWLRHQLPFSTHGLRQDHPLPGVFQMMSVFI